MVEGIIYYQLVLLVYMELDESSTHDMSFNFTAIPT